MPKTHMGWAKRTIEKEKTDMQEQQRQFEAKNQAVLQAEARRQQQEKVLGGMGGCGGSSLRSLGVASGPNLARTRFTDEVHLGTVLEWNGKFGWIRSHVQISHPLAGKHGGKIYVARQDIVSANGVQ
eukprot:CAMPEP_0178428770 /NCGR_PEP_ID=MMETSP0689_2-20121128/30454_1 /TAXON_ID=160604 /ORGANISM="Amphidinium massartii, Strain CS-259" /LENGTH=126 /DNA_ID=CAMNT_0020050563 /DNA_START=35 /DNA_END=412 /DNA_ORIENTATION=-